MYAPSPRATTRSAIVEGSPRITASATRHFPPVAKIASGMISSENHVTMLCWAAFIVSRRSLGSFGRMEIRFSLREPAQRVHEEIPYSSRPEQHVRREIGVAEHDQPGFRLRRGALAFGRRLGVADRCRHGRGNRYRSRLVARPFVLRRLLARVERLQIGFAQLRWLVSTMVCAVWPSLPPVTGETDRASGNAVKSWNRSVIGWGG